MIFPFFLSWQTKKAYTRYKALNIPTPAMLEKEFTLNREKLGKYSYKEFQTTSNKAAAAQELFSEKNNRQWQYLKSFLPGTDNFSKRRELARALNELAAAITILEKSLPRYEYKKEEKPSIKFEILKPSKPISTDYAFDLLTAKKVKAMPDDNPVNNRIPTRRPR